MKNMKRVLICLLVLCLAGGAAFGALMGIRHVRHLYYQMLGLVDSVGSQVADLYRMNAQEYATLMREQKEKGMVPVFDYGWMNAGNHLICHALGEIDGETYTNSREAFLASYEKGYRVFEVDFMMTAQENAVVLGHDLEWAKGGEDSYRAYMSGGGKFTRMDLKDWIALMHEYQDIYLITDTKYTDEWSVRLLFTQLVYEANRMDATVMGRIIPQVFSEGMYRTLMDLYPFSSVINTLYMTGGWTADSVEEMCRRTGIGFVTMPVWVTDRDPVAQWKEHGLLTAIHTVNDPEEAKRYLEKGFDMLYTDSLNPDGFAEEEEE